MLGLLTGDIRRTYLSTAAAARPLISHPDIARRWDEPSVLAKWTIRGLTGHLVRAVGSTVAYLARPEPEGPAIDAASYYAEAVETTDIDAPLNVAIRERGDAEAEGGPAVLLARYDELSLQLEQQLENEPPTRKVRVHKDLVVLLDQYLITRIIELLVHMDDLALTIGVPTPVPDPDAAGAAIDTLVRVARLRLGDTAVLRALTRRERDDVNALRVI